MKSIPKANHKPIQLVGVHRHLTEILHSLLRNEQVDVANTKVRMADDFAAIEFFLVAVAH
jgi:hypothetical protein